MGGLGPHGHNASMELFRDLRLGAFTGNVAVSRSARFIRKHIVDDSIIVIGRDPVGHLVEPQGMPQSPGYIVIGARRIAADPSPPTMSLPE